MGLNESWARSQLAGFVALTQTTDVPSELAAPQDMIIDAAEVVEQVLNRVLPRWRTEITVDRWGYWGQHREAAQRALVRLNRAEELSLKLGDDAPALDAGRLHPWVWEGARSMWASEHYAQAVNAAAIKVNAETQNKVGRRNVSETKLFQEVFSTDAPAPGRPRLRLQTDDGGETYKNVHRGARALAERLYAAIRNPIAHETDADLSEQDALERLAAFSILARWIDSAKVVAEDPSVTGHLPQHL